MTAVAHELGRRMCGAWGIDPALCTGIHVIWVPDEMPYAVVQLALTEGAVSELLFLGVVEREWIAQL